MSPVTPTGRRAERFDAALAGAPVTGLDTATVALLETVAALRAVPAPPARPEFVADLRGRLLAEAAELAPVARPGRPAPVPSARRRRERRVAVALGGLALVGATSTMAVAAQSALPGDTLYPLKRAIEDADTSLRADDTRGPVLLTHASDRLAEVDELSRVDLDDREAMVIESTLDTFSEQATEASDLMLATFERTGDEATVVELRGFAGASLESLARIESELPQSVRPAVLRAAQTLFRIDSAASQACPACDAAGITQVPGSLVSASTPTVLRDDRRLGVYVAPAVESARRTPAADTGVTTSPAPKTKPGAGTTESPAPDPLPVDDGGLLPPTTTKGGSGDGKTSDGSGRTGAGGGQLPGLGTVLGQGTPGAGQTTSAPASPLGGLLGPVDDAVGGVTGGILPTTP